MNPKSRQWLREQAEKGEAERAAYEREHPVNRGAVWGSGVGILGGIALSLVLDAVIDGGGRAAAVGSLVAVFSSMAVYVPTARH